LVAQAALLRLVSPSSALEAVQANAVSRAKKPYSSSASCHTTMRNVLRTLQAPTEM